MLEQDDYQRTAEFYDATLAYATRPDVDFYVDEARRSGGPVLELGCGTGRVLLPIARAGVPITGVDHSRGMLGACRAKVAAEPEAVRQRVTLIQASMTEFAVDGSFALVTFPFRPFQHLLTVDDQLATLARVRQVLAPDGRVIIDVFNPLLEALVDGSKAEPYRDGEPMTLPDGRWVQRWASIPEKDLLHQLLRIVFTYEVRWPGGREEQVTDRFSLRYSFRYELEHLLVRAGFAVDAVYAGYDREPYGERYPGELILVARPA